MKLKLSENIKRARRAGGITQEQLAAALGVSFQSVSRWETDTAYPDIELLPVIAGYFGITVDELIGAERTKTALRYEEYTKQVKELRGQGKEEECIKLLKRMHAEFPDRFEIVCDFCSSVLRLPEYLDEAREMVYDGLSRCTDVTIREQMIISFSWVESEERLPEFLGNYSSVHDMREMNLLRLRYQARKDKNGYDQARQRYMADLLSFCFSTLTNEWRGEAEEREAVARRVIACIDALTGCEANNPVSGDGEPDLWLGIRGIAAVRLMKVLAEEGRTDEVIEILEDVTALYRKYFSLPDGTAVSYRTPLLRGISTRSEHYTVPGDEAGKTVNRRKFVYDSPMGALSRDAEYSMMLVYPERTVDFIREHDELKDNERVMRCLEVLEKLLYRTT